MCPPKTSCNFSSCLVTNALIHEETRFHCAVIRKETFVLYVLHPQQSMIKFTFTGNERSNWYRLKDLDGQLGQKQSCTETHKPVGVVHR